MSESSSHGKQSNCKGCGREWISSTGIPYHPQGTGFCANCRKNTLAGKEAMSSFNIARQAKRIAKMKEMGTYSEHNARRVKTNLKRRQAIKNNDPERYKQIFLDSSKNKYAELKANDPEKYQRHRDMIKEHHNHLKKDNDTAWIEYIELNRPQCTRAGCNVSIACCIQFNHIDAAQKKFKICSNEFKIHKQGTTDQWKAEELKVEALCLFHHLDLTFSHTPEPVNRSGRMCADRYAAKQFKLAAKSCVACGKTLALASPGYVEPAELAKFHVDHISRATRTTHENQNENQGLKMSDEGLQLLCAHCHCMKTAGENCHIFETILSRYYWDNVPSWFQKWFETNTNGEDWTQRREDWLKRRTEGLEISAKRRKLDTAANSEQLRERNVEDMQEIHTISNKDEHEDNMSF